jgi:uncharacterized membrane protein YgcG
MFYDSVHRLRLWLWRRQERMLERTHRLRRRDCDSTVPNVSTTAVYGAGADAGACAGAFSGYADTSISSMSCSGSGSSCSSSSDGGSSGGGGD